MLKAMLTMLGAAGGLVEGVVFFVVIDYFVQTSPAEVEPGVWSGYGMFVFGVVGAFTGAALGWASHTLFNKRPGVKFTRAPSPGLGSLSKSEARS